MHIFLHQQFVLKLRNIGLEPGPNINSSVITNKQIGIQLCNVQEKTEVALVFTLFLKKLLLYWKLWQEIVSDCFMKCFTLNRISILSIREN